MSNEELKFLQDAPLVEIQKAVANVPREEMEELDSFTYEINRKVPFIIWSKDIVGTDYSTTETQVMGMIDIMPTFGR